MITEFLLDMIEAVLSWIISLVPDFTPPSFLTSGDFADACLSMADLARPMAPWFPFGLLVLVGLLVFGIRVSVMAVQVIVKLYAMIRGGAS